MNIFSFLCIIIFISFIYFGVYVIKKDSKNNINRLFFLICLSLSLWVLFAGIAFSSENKETVFFWYKTAMPFIFLFMSINTHFNFELTGKKIKNRFIPILYLPAIILIIMTITSTTLYSDCFRHEGNWKFIITPNTFGFIFYILFIFFNFSVVIFSLLRWRKKTKLQKIKKQARLILTVYCIFAFVSILSDFVFPAFEFYTLANSGPIALLVYIFGLWYSMVRYKFLVFQPSMAANKIISNIQEMVILLNSKLEIINVNNACAELLQYNPEEFNNKTYSDLIIESGYFANELNKLAEKELKSFNVKIQYKGRFENIFTDTYFASVLDDFEDLIGILVISRENKGLKEFQRKYNITNRQLEIISLSVSGFSNIEIGQKLTLAERTIETHLSNIYHKLGINNKIGLLNISREYNVI